ncbi:hypothetical protein [Mycobacteroides abscessus]|uniref:hypothetical protein n=1 Tax=Mycobacteroides abscessus TaxID=36809 RepID=UPI0002DCC89F|nr:hypothetical protein [Mycobacteroides abscessus]SKU21678.1 Uncharacterised protein [Mycobacteroides abscessus subsp. massiliense]
MSNNRGTRRSQPKKHAGKAGAKPPVHLGRPLAWQQYTELNFSFYQEHPSEYILMRLEVLSLMLAPTDRLEPAYAATRPLRGVWLGPTTPPAEDRRRRYLQTEALVIFHHATEMVLRMFYAHVEHAECPWKGLATLINFAEFKAKVGGMVSDGFDRSQLAEIFLGGSSPQDACIAMSLEDFEDAIDGLDLLLRHCAGRLLDESYLYNSIKHGLSTISLLDDVKWAVTPPDGGETVVGYNGPMFAYMHKQRFPNAPKGEREWFVSMTGATSEQDLALTLMLAKAVESLWDVAARRYTGRSGSVRHIKKRSVELIIYGMLCDSLNIVDTITMEMPKLNDDMTYGGVQYDCRTNYVAEDYEAGPAGEVTLDIPAIVLPARQKDQQVYSTANRRFYPFSPKGSQRA